MNEEEARRDYARECLGDLGPHSELKSFESLKPSIYDLFSYLLKRVEFLEEENSFLREEVERSVKKFW